MLIRSITQNAMDNIFSIRQFPSPEHPYIAFPQKNLAVLDYRGDRAAKQTIMYHILFSRKEIDLFWLVFRHSLIVAFIVSRHVVIRLF